MKGRTVIMITHRSYDGRRHDCRSPQRDRAEQGQHDISGAQPDLCVILGEFDGIAASPVTQLRGADPAWRAH